jgi:hypothetical protein
MTKVVFESVKEACGFFADQFINSLKHMKRNTAVNTISDLMTTFDGERVFYPSKRGAVIRDRLQKGQMMDRINLEKDMIIALDKEHVLRTARK